jgi:hypothetical protein
MAFQAGASRDHLNVIVWIISGRAVNCRSRSRCSKEICSILLDLIRYVNDYDSWNVSQGEMQPGRILIV